MRFVAWNAPPDFIRRRGGRFADDILRFAIFLAIGASVALGNLVFVWFIARQHLLPYVTSITIATELSILASFVGNDRITFQGFRSAGRGWPIRLLRFHSAAALGAIFTIATSTAIYHLLHLRPVGAQLSAIVLATGLNFVMHRLWTYRGKVVQLEHRQGEDAVIIGET